MPEQPAGIDTLVLLGGLLLVVTILIRAGASRLGVPSLVGFLVLGVLLRMADEHLGLLGEPAIAVFEFMSGIGIVALLFRIGLESDIAGLRGQLGQAVPIWFGNVLVAGVPSYFIATGLFGLAQIPSLFIAVALTATSVGVSVSVWQEAGAIRSPNGERLIDVAELDDISGVALMALLLAVVNILHRQSGDGLDNSMWLVLGETGLVFTIKLVVFAFGCYLLARYAERPFALHARRLLAPTEVTILIAGIGTVIAATAALLGFSLAIGALFAGLIFSRDRERLRDDHAYNSFRDIFVPFFFIGIGLDIAPGALTSGLGLGAGLLALAVLTKVVGTGAPALLFTGWRGATLLGISMVPRAEIAMIVMERGRSLGDWAVPPEVYAAMVVVSALTCLGVPYLLGSLLRRWPQTEP